MKTKNIIELLSFVGIITTYIIGSIIYNMVSETAISEYAYARTVEPTDDGHFYMIKNNSYTSEIFKFNTQGIILKDNVELTTWPFSTTSSAFSSIMGYDGLHLYFFRVHRNATTNLIKQIDIVRLEDDGTTLLATDVYKTTGKDLPEICDVRVKNDHLYVVSMLSNLTTVQLDEFNINSSDSNNLFLKSTKKYKLPNHETVNRAIYFHGINTIAVTSNTGKIYLLSDSSEQLIYPKAEGTQSLPSFITPTLSELVFSDVEQNVVLHYNILTGETNPSNMKELMKTTKIHQRDVIYMHLSCNKRHAALATTKAYDNVKLYFWSKSVLQNIEKFKIPASIAFTKSTYFILFSSSMTTVVWAIFKGIAFLIYQKRKIVFKFVKLIFIFVSGLLILLEIIQYRILYSSLYNLKQQCSYVLGQRLITRISAESVANLANTRSSYTEDYHQLLNHTELLSMKANISDPIGRIYYYCQILIPNTEGNLLTGPSSFCTFLSPIEKVYSMKDCVHFYTTLKIGESYTGNMHNKYGNWIVHSLPIKGANGKIAGVLLIMISTRTLSLEVTVNMFANLMISITALGVLVTSIFYFFRKVLMPLTELRAAFNEIAKGNYNVQLLNRPHDEFAIINHTFNKMVTEISKNAYRLQQIHNNYDKFVSEIVLNWFGEKNIGNINAGDYFETDSVLVLQSVGNLFDTNPSNQFVKTNSDHIISFLNQVFRTTNECAVRNGGSVLANSLGGGILRTLFDAEKTQGALNYSLDVLGEIKANIPERTLDFTTLIHKDRTVLGIVGDEHNAFPVVNSKDDTRLTKLLQKLSELKVQTVVTGTSVEEAKKKYNVRYIGFSGIPSLEKRFDFFEILDGCDSNEKNKKIETQRMFEKGIDLFYAGDFYEARTTFSKVLQEHEEDAIAKQYLFMCDKYFANPNAKISYELL